MTSLLAHTAVLETERLILRAPDLSDAAALTAFITSDRAAFVGGGADKDASYGWRVLSSIAGHWALRGYGPFVMLDRDTDARIGLCGPYFPTTWPEQELTWSIWDAENEGQGYATEGNLCARAYAYDTLGWTTAVSYIDAGNTRSRALAEKLGAAPDPNAAKQDPEDLVYRHPAPEALA